MAKVLKVVAIVAGVVAVVASGGALLAGSGTFLGMSAATLGTISAIAGVVSATASFGAQVLAKPPPARGNVNQLIVETNAVHPYAMGRTYFGGVLRHVASYGPTLDKVPNPYLSRVVVYSGAGPIDGFEALQVDYGPISAYYSGFLSTSSQLGLCPETSALTAGWSDFPNWTANHKLSGQAAAMWNFKFDKNGKVFASGLPQTGAVLRGVKVYDPRLDSTFPGGSGSQRINNEATWAYSDNPALHALTYAYGRYQNGKKVFGVGLPIEAIDLTSFAAWANVCDANDWTISGLVFEPDDRWKNLKDIMAAGGAEPIFSGAKLSAKYHAPRIALDVISPEDLADGEVSVTAMRSYRERINTIVPKWRSEANNWDYVPGEAVAVSTYVTEDGEEKKEERQYNLVANANQAAQLATYELLERRELGTIELTCGPRMLSYRPGECLMLDLPDEGLDGVEAVILSRVVDPGSMTVRLTLIGETPAKHAFALGKTATPPPTPSLTMTQEERDNIAAEVKLPTRTVTVSLFQRTATSTPPTVATSGFATYNFDTGAISGQPTGWTIDVPSTGGGYLWSIRAIAESQASIDVIYNTEWSAPARVAQDGTNGANGASGLNTAQVKLYRRADTTPSAPSGTFTYTFATGVLTGGTFNGWSQSVPAANGQPLWVIMAIASSSGATDTIAGTEFSSPVVETGAGLNTATVRLYQRATAAPALPASALTYTFSTALLSGTLGSWSQSVPSGTNPLWVTQAAAVSPDNTDTILSSEWSTPVIEAQDGATGPAGPTGAPGADGINGRLTNESHTLFAYANGNIVDYVGATGSFVITSGSTDISTNFTLSSASNPQNLTVTYSGRTYTVTGGFDANEDTATLTIRATGSGTYSGVTIDKVFSLSKAKGGYEIVATLPTTNLFEGRMVFLTADDKLYRYTGSAWTSAVPALDITGEITETQIGAQAITAPKIYAGTTQSKLIQANNIATNAIIADKIDAGAITAAKVGTNEIIAFTANIKDGVIRTAKIDDLQVSTIKIANFAVNSVSAVQSTTTITVPAYTTLFDQLPVTFTKLGGTESNIVIQVGAIFSNLDLVSSVVLNRNGNSLTERVVCAGNGTYQAVIPISLFYLDSGLAAGTYTYSINIGNYLSSSTLNATIYGPITIVVQEVKK